METESELHKVSCSKHFQKLISCIESHKQSKNTKIIIESLKTIVNICEDEELGRHVFRDVGGLDFLLQFLIETDQLIILEYSLKVLAFVIDGNVGSQMHMTNPRVFGVLQTIFDRKTHLQNTVKNALVLLTTISLQNRVAQDLLFENGCLTTLINLYKIYLPKIMDCGTSDDLGLLDVWINVNSALCFAVSNPLNEKNQELCSELFPLSLRTIETSSSLAIIEASSLFLSVVLANNKINQTVFAEANGFPILMRSLSKAFDDLQSFMDQCNNCVRKETLLVISSLISVINASVLHHESNASHCGKLGVVSLMIKRIFVGVLTPPVIKKILLTLCHCTDVCDKNRLIVMNTPDFDLLLKKNIEDDPEIVLAAKCLLKICTKNFDDNSIGFNEVSSRFQNMDEQSLTVQRCLGNNFMPRFRNEWENTMFQRKSDTFRNILETQDVMSCKEGNDKAEVGNYTFNTQPEKNKAKQSDYQFLNENVYGQNMRIKKPKLTLENIFSLGKNLERISEDDPDFESAEHLHGKKQIIFLESYENAMGFGMKERDFKNKLTSFFPPDLEINLNVHSDDASMSLKFSKENLKKSKQNVSESQDFTLGDCEQNSFTRFINKRNDRSLKNTLGIVSSVNACSATTKEPDIGCDSAFLKASKTRNLKTISSSFENIIEENSCKWDAVDSIGCSSIKTNTDNIKLPENLKKSDTIELIESKDKSDINSFCEKRGKNNYPGNSRENPCELGNLTTEFTPHFLSDESTTGQKNIHP